MRRSILSCAAFLSLCGGDLRAQPDGGEELIDLPPKFVDPNHPRPTWVDTLASELNSKSRPAAIAQFRRLRIDQQIEFAVFMQIDQHPGTLEWSVLVAHEGKKILPVLETSIAREASDRFVLGLMKIVDLIGREHGLAGHPMLYETMLDRVARMDNPARWYGTELLTRIARYERQSD